MNDSELVALLRSGDNEAFELLMLKYKAPLFSFIKRLTGNNEEAADIFQETFIKVFKNLDKYSEQGQFKSWIFKMAANLTMDTLRKKGKLSGTCSMDADTETYSWHEVIADSAPTPEQLCQEKEQTICLEKALAQLPPEQREVIYLREFSGLSFKEIAKILNCPIGTVLARMSRGLSKLRSIREVQNACS